MMPNDLSRFVRGGAGKSRGISEVLGVVLVLGMIFAATAVVVAVGAVTFQQSQDQVSMESAVTSMTELNERIREVASRPGEQATVQISEVSGDDLRVEDSGKVNVTVGNKTTDVKLGKIVYERNDQAVAIQAGGVWQTHEGSDAASIRTEPTFQYRYRSGTPTLTFPVIQLGDAEINGDTVTVRGDATSRNLLADVNPIEPGQQLNLTVESEFYQAWAEIFEEQTGVTPDVDHSEERVKLTLDGPPEPPIGVSNGATFFGPAKITNTGRVDSYDSSVSGYGTWPEKNNGNVEIDGIGKLDSRQNPQIHGDFVATGRGSFANGPDVFGDTILGEDGKTTEVQNDADFHGLFSTEGSVSIQSGAHTFGGDLIVGEDVTELRDTYVDGTMHVNGSLDATFTNVSVTGDVIIEESATIDDWSTSISSTVDGDIIAHDTIDFKGVGTEASNVRADSTVTLEGYGVNYKFDIRSTDDVVVKSGVDLDGNITASGTVTVEGDVSGDVTTNGDVIVPGHISGNVTAGGSISDKSNVDGTADDGVSPPPVGITIDEHPRTALEPTVTTFPSKESKIEEKREELYVKGNNDNAGAPIADIESDNCDSGCTLTAGSYALDNIDIGHKGTLHLESSGSGTIELFVENNARIAGKVDIDQNTQVRMYVRGKSATAGGHFAMDHKSSEIDIPNDRAEQFWVYMWPGSEIKFVKSTFTGVMYGVGGPSGPSSDVTITNDVTVKGALLADPPTPVSAGVSIHFDEALINPSIDRYMDDPDGTRIEYVHISSQSVSLGN